MRVHTVLLGGFHWTPSALTAILFLAVLALAVFLVYKLFQRIINPLVKWIFKRGAPAEETEDAKPSIP
jgi:hypothetical protein